MKRPTGPVRRLRGLVAAAPVFLALLMVVPAGAGPTTPMAPLDAAPAVDFTVPAAGATGVAVDADVTVSFTEAVTFGAGSFTLSCGSSGAHTLALGASPAVSVTLDPSGLFTHGELCTLTVVASGVSDLDVDDPPDEMAADFVASFTVTAVLDAAPAVDFTVPAAGATGVAVDADVTVSFTEAVTFGAGSFTLSCGSSGAHTLALGASPAVSVTLDPSGLFTHGEVCTLTVVASGVSDLDVDDPPDEMAADFVASFTVTAVLDAAPAVDFTVPAAGATGVAVDADVTVSFTEAVTFGAGSFTLSCGSSGAHTLALGASPAVSVTLDPSGLFTHGEVCTLTVVASGVSDLDVDDPPDTMAGNYVFSFNTGAPTAVEVSSFSANRSAAGVYLRWRTGSESRVLGFNVYREQAGKRIRLNRRLIAAGAEAHVYRWRDGRPGARSGRYWLQLVPVDGSRAWAGALQAR